MYKGAKLTIMSIKTAQFGSLLVSTFFVYGKQIKVKNNQPIRFSIEYDGTVYYVEDVDIGVYVYSLKKESLQRELNENLAVVWSEYALEKNKNLTAGGKELKRNLLRLFTEVS